jgi:hypothetical protein
MYSLSISIPYLLSTIGFGLRRRCSTKSVLRQFSRLKLPRTPLTNTHKIPKRGTSGEWLVPPFTLFHTSSIQSPAGRTIRHHLRFHLSGLFSDLLSSGIVLSSFTLFTADEALVKSLWHSAENLALHKTSFCSMLNLKLLLGFKTTLPQASDTP